MRLMTKLVGIAKHGIQSFSELPVRKVCLPAENNYLPGTITPPHQLTIDNLTYYFSVPFYTSGFV